MLMTKDSSPQTEAGPGPPSPLGTMITAQDTSRKEPLKLSQVLLTLGEVHELQGRRLYTSLCQRSYRIAFNLFLRRKGPQ